MGVRVTASQQDGMEELVSRFRQPLLAYFTRRTSSPAEAEDLAQDLFLRLVGREGLDRIENLDGYVFTVAANLLRDRGRKATARMVGAHISEAAYRFTAEFGFLGGARHFHQPVRCAAHK